MRYDGRLRALTAVLAALVLVLSACGGRDVPETDGPGADRAAGEVAPETDLNEAAEGSGQDPAAPGADRAAGGVASEGSGQDPTAPQTGVQELSMTGSNDVLLGGEAHTLSFAIDETDEWTLLMLLDGEARSIGSACRLVSGYLITQEDGSVGLLVDGDMASDDYITYAMRYENGDFTAAEEIYGGLYRVDTDEFTITEWIDCVGTRYGMRFCTILDGFQVIVGESYHFYGDLSARPEPDELPPAEPVVTARELTLVRLEDDESVSVPAGSSLIPRESDNDSYIIFQLEDGTLASAELERGDSYGITIGGLHEEVLFQNLIYAG